MRLFSGRVFMDPGLVAAQRPGMTVGFHPNTACSSELDKVLFRKTFVERTVLLQAFLVGFHHM